jgi:hypothetical protein
MMGAVAATETWFLATIARENPITGSYGDPDATRLRSTHPS